MCILFNANIQHRYRKNEEFYADFKVEVVLKKALKNSYAKNLKKM